MNRFRTFASDRRGTVTQFLTIAMLPLMGILSVRARELAGYAILQLVFHVPVVFLLCWLFAW